MVLAGKYNILLETSHCQLSHKDELARFESSWQGYNVF